MHVSLVNNVRLTNINATSYPYLMGFYMKNILSKSFETVDDLKLQYRVHFLLATEQLCASSPLSISSHSNVKRSKVEVEETNNEKPTQATFAAWNKQRCVTCLAERIHKYL